MIFLFSQILKPVLGFNQLTIQWVLEDLSQEAKRMGRESVHSPTSR